MVKSCSAYGCTQRYVKGITFHTFPLGNETLLKKWLVALHRENFTPTKHTVICSQHFTADDYMYPPGYSKTILKPDAVPSVFDFPEDLLRGKRKRKPPLDRSKANNKIPHKQPQMETNGDSVIPSSSITDHSCSDSPDDAPAETVISSSSITDHSCSDSSDDAPSETVISSRSMILDHSYWSSSRDKTPAESFNSSRSVNKDHSSDSTPAKTIIPSSSSIIDHCYFSSPPDNAHEDESERKDSPIEAALRQKVKTLMQKLRRKENKIRNLTDALEKLKEQVRDYEMVASLDNSFSGLTRELLMNESENVAKGANGRRYSEELKKFALTLHCYSPRAYSFLRNVLCLPAPSTLSN